MFNLEPAAIEDGKDVEVLDSLPLGSIMLEAEDSSSPVEYPPLADWRDSYPYWCTPGIHARNKLGDCFVMVADAILTQQQPYPGDEVFEANGLRPELRFVVSYCRRDRNYTIRDRLVNARETIDEALFRKAQFDVSRWYAKRRRQALGLRTKLTHSFAMGHAISLVATKLLTDGVLAWYPCTKPDLDPEDRFAVYPVGPTRCDYTIRDDDLDLLVSVPKSRLEEPSFDLVGWYKQYLDQRDLFQRRYLKNHIQVYVRSAEEVSPVTTSEPDQLDIEFEYPTDEEYDSEFEDLPPLIPLSDSEDEDDDDPLGPAEMEEPVDETVPSGSDLSGGPVPADVAQSLGIENDTLTQRVMRVLTRCQPFPGDGPPVDLTYRVGEPRFVVEHQDFDILVIYDRVQGFEARICVSLLRWPVFSVGKWYAERCAHHKGLPVPWMHAHEWIIGRNWESTTMGQVAGTEPQLGEPFKFLIWRELLARGLELGGIQVDRNKYPQLQRNAAQVKDKQRVLPKPIVIRVSVNGHPARALMDTGSLGDFISSTLADQLSVKRQTLDTPLSLQLAMQGSRSKVNAVTTVRLEYQGINEERTLDVININSYDLILGTPWLYQHKVCIGFNPSRIVIGEDQSQPIRPNPETKMLVHSVSPEDQLLEVAREELRKYADPICKEVDETELPPFRAINHTIPLIDESKTYPWRPSRCPEVFREQWAEKRDAYIRSGRWQITSAGNTVPMLLIPKPGTNPPLLRTVMDLRERNKNTKKFTSPLPDMEGMLRHTASKPYRTALDLKSAYEQIRIIPEHVGRSAITTPDGNMVSQVVQMGDCNAPATYQALMNFIFSAYIGRFMDVYLDDIVIYSDTLEDHVRHVKIILDILRKEKLYLSRSKLRFIVPELTLLGRVIDANGIWMDSAKVDSVLNWKIPSNRDLLRGFIGSVGYLADDIPNVRIPLGVLSVITGDAVPFRWGYTEQRAFEEVKTLVHHAREHRRVPLNYSKGAPPIWMITDGCATGISGVISQGDDWKTAKIAAFYSAKLNSAQQNYPVHEIEMLAGIETMLRYVDLLQGAQFRWLTDHKGLIYLLNQKNLSGRQARWLEKISSFTFQVVYIRGSENVVADALSRMYSHDSSGTVRARSEFTSHDIVDDDTSFLGSAAVDIPVLAGREAVIATRRGSRVRRLTEKARFASSDFAEAESSKDFAVRMKDHFVLRGPAVPDEQKGGESSESTGNSDLPEPSQEPLQEHSDHVDDHVPDFDNHVPEQDDQITVIANEAPDTGRLLTQDNLGIDLVAELRGKYTEDSFFRAILDRLKEFRNFEVDNELIYLKENDNRVLCIPKVLVQGRSAREIIISEAHSMLAHLGANKTLDYLRDHIWWKDMVAEVKAFCETCHTCKTSQ